MNDAWSARSRALVPSTLALNYGGFGGSGGGTPVIVRPQLSHLYRVTTGPVSRPASSRRLRFSPPQYGQVRVTMAPSLPRLSLHLLYSGVSYS
jgi:hypothetical protein